MVNDGALTTTLKASFAETRKFKARNQVRRKSSSFETDGVGDAFPVPLAQVAVRSTKQKAPRGAGWTLPQGLLSRFVVFVLAEQEGL